MSICDTQFDPNCNECYEVSRADNDLTFNYGLAPNTNFYLWVVDKFENSYKALITTDGSGAFTIDPTSSVYPSGLFNKFAGDFEVFATTDLEGTTIAPFTIYATEYNCFLLTISSNTEINCSEPYNPNGCEPAFVLDGLTTTEVSGGETYTCVNGAEFNMIVNQDGVEVYNETWFASDTNTININ